MNLNKFCLLCPNGCKIDKSIQKGFCDSDNNIRIAKFYLHKFEEPCISGKNGSGTIFFCGCSLKCVFCQNYELSRNLRGKNISINELVEIFKNLEEQGAHNINLVNPTHYSDLIAKALDIYKPKIPIVYNTHSYENIETLKTMDKYIDVYLPDIKFFASNVSKRYTGKEDYFDKASKAIEFMVNKPIIFDENGMMVSGTILRHLVLPQNVSDSKNILDWFSTIKDKAYINIMSQYTPFGKIDNFPELKRKLTKREYETIVDYAINLGIEKAFYQKQESADEIYIPSWDY